MEKANIKRAWFVSGNGHILREIHIFYPIALVISNQECRGIKWAAEKGIAWGVLKGYDFSKNAQMLLEQNEIDYALMTFNTILKKPLIDKYAGRLVNFHPAPLPDFPGLNAVQKSFDKRIGGFTYHFVNEKIDEGTPVLTYKYPIIETTVEEYGSNMFWRAVEAGKVLMKWMDSKHGHE